MQFVGRIAGLFRYPVKSMAGQSVPDAKLDRYGVEGDRRLALRRREDTSGFPWLTAGRAPGLIRYRPVTELTSPAIDDWHVRSPSDEVFPLHGDSFSRHVKEVFGFDVEVLCLNQGMYDWAGVSVITCQTLTSLDALVGRSLDVLRFRPNILIDAQAAHTITALGEIGYPEDRWVGRNLRFTDASGALVRVTDCDERCSMISLDPYSGESSPDILKAVVQKRGNLAGVYATPLMVGAISVGDSVYCE